MSDAVSGSRTSTPRKLVYSTPTLTVFGGLRELTLSKDFGPMDDNNTKAKAKT